jgi:6,7-dimethyl-8-ribityllumazine synthase
MADEKPIEKSVSGANRRFAIVAARFNQSVVDPMISGALDTLENHDTDVTAVAVVRVPGCFELPLVAKKLAEKSDVDAVIALGAVVRGETAHFNFVAGECAAGLQRAALETGVPMIFGVLTTDTKEQAAERADSAKGNKGGEAALAALEMADLLYRL